MTDKDNGLADKIEQASEGSRELVHYPHFISPVHIQGAECGLSYARMTMRGADVTCPGCAASLRARKETDA